MSAAVLEPVAAGNAHELGELREEFSFARRDMITTAIVVGVVAIWVPLVFYLKNPAILSPRNTWDWTMTWGCLALTLAVVVGGGIILFRIHRRRHLRVLVYEHGFVSQRQDDVFTCRWDEVESTRELFGPRNRPSRFCAELHGLTVRCRGDREWTLNRMDECLHDSQRLAELIQQQVGQAKLPQALADLYKGRTLEFGPIQLSFLGLTSLHETFMWGDLKKVTRPGLTLQLRRRGLFGDTATVPARDLINKHLLLSIADAMCQGRRG